MSLWMDSIRRANSDVKRKEDSLINKTMRVLDNTYITNLTDSSIYANVDLFGKDVIIISEKFEKKHMTSWGAIRHHTFVKVKYNDEIYECLFNEKWLIQ